ncbi:hypothetical protein [Sulfurimonas sp.]|uniref:hypothetical protein n=1 Tax=Sulfurimonas sp. TaxID=2022749 RepID=UPI0035689F14
MKPLIPLFVVSFAYAEGIDPNALDSIYNEAILYLTIFSIMSIVSYVISKRNAKKYEQEHSLKDRKAANKKEELEDFYLSTMTKENEDKIAKLKELSKLLKDGIITKEEFDILKESLNINGEK